MNQAIAPHKMLAHYGKSFAWAAAVLPAQQLRDARTVYAFCRYIDDIVDETDNTTQAAAQLDNIRQSVGIAKSDDPIVRDMIACQQRLGIPSLVLQQLIDGVAFDLTQAEIENEAQLLQYSYGVAGTVGVLMCYVFGVHDKQAHRYAIDLGLAMQMTNIARDVIEDANRNRIYLPKTWLDKSTTVEQIRTQALSEQNEKALQHLLKLADCYYQSADAGLAYLPWRARMSIIIASRVYQAIGHKIQKLSAAEYQKAGRVYTSRFEKIKLSLNALRALCFQRRYYTPGLKRHQEHLHFRIKELLRDVC